MGFSKRHRNSLKQRKPRSTRRRYRKQRGGDIETFTFDTTDKLLTYIGISKHRLIQVRKDDKLLAGMTLIAFKATFEGHEGQFKTSQYNNYVVKEDFVITNDNISSYSFDFA